MKMTGPNPRLLVDMIRWGTTNIVALFVAIGRLISTPSVESPELLALLAFCHALVLKFASLHRQMNLACIVSSIGLR